MVREIPRWTKKMIDNPDKMAYMRGVYKEQDAVEYEVIEAARAYIQAHRFGTGSIDETFDELRNSMALLDTIEEAVEHYHKTQSEKYEEGDYDENFNKLMNIFNEIDIKEYDHNRQ